MLQHRQNLGQRFGTSKMHVRPPVALATVRSKAVVLIVDSMLIVTCTPIVGFCNSSMFCCALPYVHSSFAIILMGKRKLVALLVCLPGVSWLLRGSSSRCDGFVCSL